MGAFNKIKELLNYDKDSGIFTWAVKRGNRPVGSIAGHKHVTYKYVYITINRKKYMAHRLAWFITHKVWPKNDIDHINNMRDDNRLVNLREATRSENLQNLNKPNSRNESGFLGVSTNKKSKIRPFIARLDTKYIGSFKTAKEAHLAYISVKEKEYPFWVKTGA
jgi:hypothetical protein